MTRPSKKEHEKRLARSFLEGWLDYDDLAEGEQPDFRIVRKAGDIPLEVREYHEETPEGDTDRSRLRVELVWWRWLEPAINTERQTRSSLKNIHARVRFAERRFPHERHSPTIARELVAAVEAVVRDGQFHGKEVEVDFAAGADLGTIGNYQDDDTILLPQENWPELNKRLESLSVSRQPTVEWPQWHCQNATVAWIGPDVEEFKRILNDKTEAAKHYTLNGLPLWLLIVCDPVDDGGEAHGDLAAHIFPRNAAEREKLYDVLNQTGFDLQAGPFSEVWLFSSFTGERLRLHPRVE